MSGDKKMVGIQTITTNIIIIIITIIIIIIIIIIINSISYETQRFNAEFTRALQ